jgi:environmental stress-induced protein Ves
MAARLLKRTDHRRMPWKNGGGETIEIAVGPNGAGLDDFDWRVSLAHVERDGPFSAFPGIDRTLSLVEGNGIVLSFDHGEAVAMTVESAPFSFAGDVAVQGHLMDGAVVDLNVMTRRGRARSVVTRIGHALAFHAPVADIAIVYCHGTRGEVTTEGNVIGVEAGEALVIFDPSAMSIEGGSGIYLIRLILGCGD